jgi:glycerol-3-phosphate acyltransferase PlsX
MFLRILVDAMGGDNAPKEIVKGCIEAINEKDGFELELLGDPKKIEKCLKNKTFDRSRVIITATYDEVTNTDKPTEAIRKKQKSSLIVGIKKIKSKNADVFISAGSTGVLLAGSLLIAGRIKGVLRPALAPIVPSLNGPAMIIDAGMNTQAKPINYLQFAIMGTEYMKYMHDIENPRVGLINVGTESTKGNEIVKSAYEILKSSDINFIGNVEGRDIPEGNVDIVVCDGFVGNTMLKVMEGTGHYLMHNLKHIYSSSLAGKLGYLLIKRDLKKLKRQIDPEEIGGTPILGINGLVYKCHGNSKSKAIKNTILKACDFASKNIMEHMNYRFSQINTTHIETGKAAL